MSASSNRKRRRVSSSTAVVTTVSRPGVVRAARRFSLAAKMKIPRPFKLDQHYFSVKQLAKFQTANCNYTAGTLSSAGVSGEGEYIGLSTGPAFVGMGFTLTDCPNAGLFTQLFDQYRINYIEVEFIPEFTSSELSTNGATGVATGMLYGTVDGDDNAQPTSIDYLREYDICKETHVTKKSKFGFKPRLALAAYSGAFTSYANQQAGWIDCASNGVIHYGLKFGMPTQNALAIARFVVKLTYWMTFRAVR